MESENLLEKKKNNSIDFDDTIPFPGIIDIEANNKVTETATANTPLTPTQTPIPTQLSTHAPTPSPFIQGFVLFLACFIIFGNYYCYDLPGALNQSLKLWMGLEKDEFISQLNLLYAVYSIPNIFLPLVSGWMMDVVGVRRVLQLVTTLVLCGQCLFSLGMSIRSFPVMLAGRLLFGLGGESLEVVQAKITSDWFRGKYLALALGLNITTLRLATALNDNVSPRVASQLGPYSASWLGFGICLAAWLCSITLAYLHHRYHERFHHELTAGDGAGIPKEEEEEIVGDNRKRSASLLARTNDSSSAGSFSLRNRKNSHSSSSHNSKSPLLTSTSSSSSLPSAASSSSLLLGGGGGGEEDVVNAGVVEKSLFGIIRSFPFSFYHLSAIVILLYGVIVPFGHISSGFLQQKYLSAVANDSGGGDSSNETAGSYMSIPDIVSAILAPIFGYFIDRQTWSIKSDEGDGNGDADEGDRNNDRNGHSRDDENDQVNIEIIEGKDSLINADTAAGKEEEKNTIVAAWLIGRWMPLAGAGLMLVHICFAFVPASVLPAIPILMVLGSSYSLLTSVLWPIIPWLVPQKHSGTAYGISSVSLNISLTLFPILVTHIFSAWESSYLAVEIFFISLSASGLVLSLIFVLARWRAYHSHRKLKVAEKVVLLK